MAYPLEAKLRPPVEWLSAGAFLVGASAILLRPEWWVGSHTTGAITSAVLTGLAGWRIWQGLEVRRYQKNLRSLKRYVLRPEDIPWSNERMFLGRGFRWTQRHTQRLTDARLPKNLKYRDPTTLYLMARRFERWAEHRQQWRWLTQYTSSAATWSPVAPLPDVGGDPELHGVEPQESDVWTALSNRVGHFLVLGTTRVGKTRLCELLVTQDIRRGDVVVVFDPKGDSALLRRMYAEAKRSGRADKFYVFHLGYPDISAAYNPVGSFGRITEVATRTTDPLPAEGNSAAFKEFVWRFVNVLAKAMVALGERPDFQRIYEYAVDTELLALRYFEKRLDQLLPGWRDQFDPDAGATKSIQEQVKKTGRSARTMALVAFMREKGVREPLIDALVSVLMNDRTYFDKLVSSLYPLLEKLTTGKMSRLISPDYEAMDGRPIIDWLNVINQGGIVYVGLDSLSDHEVAGAVGTAMFADLTSTAGQIYKHGAGFGQEAPTSRKFSLHADEFNELVGNTFIPMVNKAGGANYQVTAYTQTWADVEAKIGSAAKAEQIGGNFNSLVMLRVQNTNTAEILTERLPEVDVFTMLASSSVSDTNDPTDFAEFASRNEDRLSTIQVPTLTPADLVRLPKGQAFCMLDGGQLWKVRLPLADDTSDAMLPKELDAMIRDMERREAVVSESKDRDQASITVEGLGHGW